MRKAEKDLNNAHVAVQQADKAINQNQDPQAVYDLIQTLKDAYMTSLDKEFDLVRKQAFMDILYQDFVRLNEARDQVLRDRLNAELAVATGELDGLKETYNTAKTAKDTWDAEDVTLKAARAALDTQTPAAEQSAKDAAD